MFQRIDPDSLNGRQKEIYNFQKSAALLADYGFDCMRLTDDWHGADFLAHHFDGKTTLKVQLKGRLTIDRKYSSQEVWMNFPSGGTWYLAPHDDLVYLVGQTTNWLNTASWRERGHYSSANPSPALLEKLQSFALDPAQEPPAAGVLESDETPTPPRKNESVPRRARSSHSRPSRHPNVSYAAEALERAGYRCAPPSIGLVETDILARRQDDAAAIHVRCPGRLHISKRRIEEDVHIVFQDQDGVWYLAPHDELVTIIGRTTPWLESPSWRVNGAYSSAAPSHRLRDAIQHFALNITR